MRYLAIDYGLKRVGLALCDASETIVSPLRQLSGASCRAGFLAEKLKKIIGEHEVDALVVGLPLNMDGSEGGQAKLTRRVADELTRQLDLPLYFQDERLSSSAADEKLDQGDFTRNKRRQRRDMLAACEILQDFLDRQQH